MARLADDSGALRLVGAGRGLSPTTAAPRLTGILAAFTSAAGNNGSAFAGPNANTPLATPRSAHHAHRPLDDRPGARHHRALAGKKTCRRAPGTLPTNGFTFAALLVGVIVIVGALTFFPVLALGPVVEHFLAGTGRVF